MPATNFKQEYSYTVIQRMYVPHGLSRLLLAILPYEEEETVPYCRHPFPVGSRMQEINLQEKRKSSLNYVMHMYRLSWIARKLKERRPSTLINAMIWRQRHMRKQSLELNVLLPALASSK